MAEVSGGGEKVAEGVVQNSIGQIEIRGEFGTDTFPLLALLPFLVLNPLPTFATCPSASRANKWWRKTTEKQTKHGNAFMLLPL